MTTMEQLLQANAVKSVAASLTTEQKNQALLAMADCLEQASETILQENKLDMEQAKDTLSTVMLDRLALSEARIHAMAEGIREVVALPDPVGRVLERIERPSGLVIEKTSVPMGVVALIYESRPNVTSDAATLALKSGNVCMLRAGKEAHRSACAITQAMQRGLESVGLPANLINIVQDTSRESANVLMTAVGLVDLLIPRGGAGLIRACIENAKVPCIETGTGICHIYVDRDADLDMALAIIENAKASRPSVCNAEEVCLVAEAVAEEFLPRLQHRLTVERREKQLPEVSLRLDPKAAAVISGTPAGERDFDREFLDYVLAVKVVKDVDEAIAHIAQHSTHHSDGIVTENRAAAQKFMRLVDSAAVYVNASTRFTDGGEFGLGCEIGISTQKLHTRGPMGLQALNTYKYLVWGSGQIR